MVPPLARKLGSMTYIQILSVTTPDEIGVPMNIVQRSLQEYLNHDERWRMVVVELQVTIEVPEPEEE